MLQNDEYKYKSLMLNLDNSFILSYNIIDKNGENKGVNGSQLSSNSIVILKKTKEKCRSVVRGRGGIMK